MPGTNPESKQKWSANVVRNFTNAVLIGFTLLIGIACVIVLAATLTQTRISSVTIDGVPVSIWKLDSIREQWASLRTQVTSQTAAIRKAEDQRLELSDKKSKVSANANGVKQILTQQIENLAYKVQKADTDLYSSLIGESDIPDKMARINASDSALRANSDLHVADLLDSIQKANAAYVGFDSEAYGLTVQINSVIEKTKALTEGRTATQGQINAIIETIKTNRGGSDATKTDLDDQTRTRIENALYELNPNNSRFSELMNRLVLLQPDVLALSLVLLMGVLGSSLQILNSIFSANRTEEVNSDTIGNYILRISVGAITALVIFIVSKAGIPVIADTSKLGGDAPINPYFVSFLAIISGLLSEQAIITVQNQGARLFASGTTEPDRWARTDLTPQLEMQKVAIGALADYLGTSEGTARSILTGAIKATADQQRVVAISLRSTVRDLFSDIPPPPKPETVDRNVPTPPKPETVDPNVPTPPKPETVDPNVPTPPKPETADEKGDAQGTDSNVDKK